MPSPKTAAPGAVSDKKEGCCSSTKTSAKADGCAATCPATKTEAKTEAKTCPMTGETSKDASMGAVSDKKDGCCKAKSSCTKQG